MRLLIVEDEDPIAEFIKDTCQELLGPKIKKLHIEYTIDQAFEFIQNNQIDLLLLDLNLHGESGYDLVKSAVAGSFHTIIISAYTDQAIEAFEYGVLDFVPKPFSEARLMKAFDRYYGLAKAETESTKYIAVRLNGENVLIPLNKIKYFKAAAIYTEAFLLNGKKELVSKPMSRLEQILPSSFIRIHRSYFVNQNQIKSFKHVAKGRYQVETHQGDVLPLSRQKYKELYDKFCL